jgi:hypothetical protein
MVQPSVLQLMLNGFGYPLTMPFVRLCGEFIERSLQAIGKNSYSGWVDSSRQSWSLPRIDLFFLQILSHKSAIGLA